MTDYRYELLILSILPWFALAILIIDQSSAASTCEREHNVYDCERVYVPVQPEGQE